MNEHDVSRLASLLAGLLEEEARNPVAPWRAPGQAPEGLDLSIPARGRGWDGLMPLLQAYIRATPKTATPRFLNQLYGGRLAPAAVADALASFLNNSMYTYKAAGLGVSVEDEVLAHMRRFAGFDQGEGAFAPGGSVSNLMAMLVARNQRRPQAREQGLGPPALVVYASDQSHYSVVKSAGVLGIGRDNVRLIESDAQGRMPPGALRAAIIADCARGREPFFLIATAGTTVLGAFDPIPALADVAQEHGLWLHVDAAWGGGALLSPALRPLLNGCGRADSLTWDAHKMMGVPLLASVLLVKKEGLLEQSLSEEATYLFQSEDSGANPGVRSLQCGRRNDALKVWAAWQFLGDEGYARRVDTLRRLALYAAERIRRDRALRLAIEPEFVNICFQVRGVDSQRLCQELDRRALLKVGYGAFRGETFIRLVFVNPDMTDSGVDETLAIIKDTARRL
ncbi:MAG TPA: pyridoxal-dependent decarboxylase [Candidatus Brocadiia bacterium]|nr:pyridoxal-dependent decarboxylase [Candidatus Brocadiia bacterium]